MWKTNSYGRLRHKMRILIYNYLRFGQFSLKYWETGLGPTRHSYLIPNSFKVNFSCRTGRTWFNIVLLHAMESLILHTELVCSGIMYFLRSRAWKGLRSQLWGRVPNCNYSLTLWCLTCLQLKVSSHLSTYRKFASIVLQLNDLAPILCSSLLQILWKESSNSLLREATFNKPVLGSSTGVCLNIFCSIM